VTATALGVDVPPTLLALAAEVIDDAPRVHIHSSARRPRRRSRRAYTSPRACGASAVLSMLLEDDSEWQACIASLL
jgi:hypothetical protein